MGATRFVLVAGHIKRALLLSVHARARWRVDQHHVKVLQAQLLKVQFNLVHGIDLAHVCADRAGVLDAATGDLCRHENGFPGLARLLEPFAHANLIAIVVGGVNVREASVESIYHDLLRQRLVVLPSSCCKDGHLHAIAERDGVGRVLGWGLASAVAALQA